MNQVPINDFSIDFSQRTAIRKTLKNKENFKRKSFGNMTQATTHVDGVQISDFVYTQ